MTPAALVREALMHNPELAAARAEREAARARVPQAAAFEDPMLEAGLVNAPLPSLSNRSEDMTMRMLGLSQKFSFPGKRPLRRAVAEADAQGIDAASEELALRIARDVRIAAARLQRLDALEPLLLDAQQSLRSLATLAEGRYALGQASQGDALAAQSTLAQLDAELIALREDRADARATLGGLLGRPAGALRVVAVATASADGIGAEGSAPGTSAADEDRWQSAAGQRPQLRSLAAMVERESRALELARRERYPDFELKLAYGQRQRAPDGMPRADMVTMSVAMNLPLFHDARQGPRVAEARAGAERAQAMLAAQRLQTRADIERQLAAAQAAQERFALAHGTLRPQADALYESRLAAYRAGRGGFDALLEARMRQLEVARAQLDARSQQDTARAQLDLLAGIDIDPDGPLPATLPGGTP
jgi:outer membrane protein TolC